jgi:hypothetical protein
VDFTPRGLNAKIFFRRQPGLRGFLRPADGDGVSHCDLGAYELRGAPLVFTGLFRPVDNPNVVNVAKAGSAIPIILAWEETTA